MQDITDSSATPAKQADVARFAKRLEALESSFRKSKLGGGAGDRVRTPAATPEQPRTKDAKRNVSNSKSPSPVRSQRKNSNGNGKRRDNAANNLIQSRTTSNPSHGSASTSQRKPATTAKERTDSKKRIEPRAGRSGSVERKKESRKAPNATRATKRGPQRK